MQHNFSLLKRTVMKSILPAFLLFAVILIAGEVAAWNVTITNPTNWTVKVGVWVQDFGPSTRIPPARIGPGQSHTFETGGWCPDGFYGFFDDDQSKLSPYLLQAITCLGLPTTGSDLQLSLSTCCWNMNVRIANLYGDGKNPRAPGEFGFIIK